MPAHLLWGGAIDHLVQCEQHAISKVRKERLTLKFRKEMRKLKQCRDNGIGGK